MNKNVTSKVILEGSIHKNLFLLSLPGIGINLLLSINSVADRFFIGRLGSQSIAVVTVVQELRIAMLTILIAVSVGAAAIIGRAVGSKDLSEAGHALRQTVLVSLVVGSLVGIAVSVFAKPILLLLGVSGASLMQATRYLRWSMCALPSLFLLVTGNTLFSVLGEPRKGFYAVFMAVTTNIIFDYLLIFGHYGFPKMGLAGGAIALGISQTVGVIAFFCYLKTTVMAGALSKSWAFDMRMIRRLLHIGLPAAVRQGTVSLTALLVQAMIWRTTHGIQASAALGIGILVESIAFLPGAAFATTAGAYVSQNLGAKQPQRALIAAYSALYQAVAIMSLAGVAFYFAAPGITVLLLPNDNELDSGRLAVQYLRLVAFSQPMIAIHIVLSGVLNAAGETHGPRNVSVIGSVFRITLVAAFIYIFKFDIFGIWLAITLTPIVTSIMTWSIFRRKVWLETTV